MPSLRHLLVDAAALALVGLGLSAAAGGYLHNLPDPAATRPAWDEPLTTGSIAPRPVPADATEAEPARAWTDPPLRTSRLVRNRPS